MKWKVFHAEEIEVKYGSKWATLPKVCNNLQYMPTKVQCISAWNNDVLTSNYTILQYKRTLLHMIKALLE